MYLFFFMPCAAQTLLFLLTLLKEMEEKFEKQNTCILGGSKCSLLRVTKLDLLTLSLHSVQMGSEIDISTL